eukprot:c20663_g1_i1.p1 GENE.c20663_g1_i1~~c20663_g1_i1.p1  ORF type:complete len:349 (+),score=66.24 c20663_g1_i1:20-1066(+)
MMIITNLGFFFVVIFTLITCNILHIFITYTFFKQEDIFWGSLMILFMIFSTGFNIFYNLMTKNYLHVFFSLLQVYTITVVIETISIKSFQLHHRYQIFIPCVIQILPTTFLLCYILLLDLHGRINEYFLETCLLIYFLTFAIGTTFFIAMSEDTFFIASCTFFHIICQFVFRMLSICCVCIRFELYSLIPIIILGIINFFFGVERATLAFKTLVNSITNKKSEITICFALKLFISKLFMLPLIFFIAMQPIYSLSDENCKILAHDCLPSQKFIFGRTIENILLITLFLGVPLSSELRSPDGSELWLTNSSYIITISLLSGCGAIASWLLIQIKSKKNNLYKQEDLEGI